jgi:hypothetical protein
MHGSPTAEPGFAPQRPARRSSSMRFVRRGYKGSSIGSWERCSRRAPGQHMAGDTARNLPRRQP